MLGYINMDACDPGLDISNLKTLIKQNTGADITLSKQQICDVYASIQGGKLPLPPLILSKDGSYLTDGKSPLTRKDFDTLFRSTTKVEELRRIAKKVGVVRYADKKLTKRQLTDIIGRRLHSMKVHEPIKLRSVQKKEIQKNAFNNLNRVNENVNRVNSNFNTNNGLGGNVKNGLRRNMNNGLGGNVNNGLRRNVNNGLGGNVNNSLSGNVNNGLRRNVNNGPNRVSFKKNNRPRFLNKQNKGTLINTKLSTPIREFTAPKQKRPAFLNKSFIKTNKIKPMPDYVFKRNNRGLGMYKNNKPNDTTTGPIQGPARGPIEGPKAIENRNREIQENEILLRSYLNRENVSKYINNAQKTNAFNRVKRGTKFNNVKTYINGIISTKITNEQRLQNQKIKIEQNRNELQKILAELTNLTNTNKNEILSKFNSNGKLNNAKTLAIQKNRNIKKIKLENLKLNLRTFLENKNVNNKGIYINRLNAGEDISNLKKEILGVINKKENERKNYDLKLRELSVLLNSSKNLNNSMKAKFLRNFEKSKDFNKVRKNIEDEFKKINNARKEGEITLRNADQRKLLQKILNNSKNFTNDDKRMFMKRLEAGNNFNTLKGNAIQAARNLAKKRKNRELEKQIIAEAEYKEEQKRQMKKLLNKIMSNSKYLNNAEKNVFRQRFNSGENFNTLKENVIKRASNLKKEYQRKEQEMREEEEKKRIRNEQKRLLNKIMGNSRDLNNTDILAFRQRFNNGENFNIIKANVIKRAQILKQNRLRKKEEEKRIVRDKQKQMLLKILNNSKNFTNANKNMFIKQFNNGGNFNTVKSNAISKAQELAKARKNKEEANRLAREKEEENRLKKEEENRIAKERAQQKKNLLKILENSKNFTNANKNMYMRQFNNGGNFDTIKSNAISKAQNLAKARKNKEEANRLAREEYEEEQRKAKEEEERKAKEEANRIKREKEREVKRARLTKILRNSKNFTNENRQEFLNRFENGENVNTIKANAISKAKELAKVRKNKEEQNRLEREKEEANRIAKEREEQRLANEEKKKKEEERKARELREKQQKLLSKILNNSKNMTNADKVAFLKRFENGGNFNTVKSNAISKAKELTKARKNREEEERKAREKEEANRKAKEEANRKAKKEEERKAKEREKQQKLLSKILNNSKNLTNVNKVTFLKRFENGGNFNTIKSNAISKAQELAKQRKAKEEQERKAREKEEANRKAKEEANRKAKEREKKQKLLSKILNNSKNLTDTNKTEFLKRFEKGETFNTVKKNAISKAQELAKQRKAKEEQERKAREKEEANRKAKEEMIEKKKAEALAKKKKEEEEKKKKEAENKKKAAQNQQMRASLTKKLKSTQMNQKVKNKLLNQLKNYSVQIKNIAPSIEKTIESEKLNGNYNEAANRKKRQEVKKQLAEYISKTYPNMTKADRKEYINRANLTQWKKGIFSGSQGMEANRAFERIKGNIERNIKSKEKNQQKKNTKANLKKLVNNTMKGRAAKNVNRLKKNINEGISEMAVKTRIAQLNKQTKYQK